MAEIIVLGGDIVTPNFVARSSLIVERVEDIVHSCDGRRKYLICYSTHKEFFYEIPPSNILLFRIMTEQNAIFGNGFCLRIDGKDYRGNGYILLGHNDTSLKNKLEYLADDVKTNFS